MESEEEKQKFLIAKINDNEKEEFFRYFSLIALEEGREVDINVWTLKELEKIVKAFKMKRNNQNNNDSSSQSDDDDESKNEEKNESNKDNIKSNEEKNESNKENIKSNEEKNESNKENIKSNEENNENNKENIKSNEENINSENESGIEKIEPNQNIEQQKKQIPNDIIQLNKKPLEELRIFFKCNKFEDAEIIHMKDLRITVSNPVLKKDGFFSFSYYQYTITTPDLNQIVERNISDFNWLYDKMKEIYPGLIVSSVPERNITIKDNSKKKLYYLNLFMNSLSHYEFIRATPIFQDFLSLPINQFQNKKKEYDKLHLPTSFKKFTNLNGCIQGIINEKNDNKAVFFYNDVFRKTSELNKLCQNIDTVLLAFEKCKNAMNNLSISFNNLQKLYYNQKAFSNKFKQLYELSDKWSKGYEEQYDFIQYEMKYFFKFMEKELTESLKVYEEFKSSREAYINKFNKMKKMKNNTKSDYLDLELMRQFYGYYLITYSEEYENLNKRHEERMNLQFIKYYENKETLIKDYNIFNSLLNINN